MRKQWSPKQRYVIVAFMDAITYCYDCEGIERIFSRMIDHAFADDQKLCSIIAQIEAEFD